MPSHASEFEHSMISVNRLEHRKSDFEVKDWMLDSGAFTRIAQGKGHMPIHDYARLIRRWSECGVLEAAVSQDYMCEPFILDIAMATVAQHQRKTLERYISLKAAVGSTYILPVLQGYQPDDYRRHLDNYNDLLLPDSWVGVGSVCKRNSSPGEVEAVLRAIRKERPDLLLHGFGLKKTALGSQYVSESLYSCDSMAWSFGARRQGGDPNSVEVAIEYADRIAKIPIQIGLWP